MQRAAALLLATILGFAAVAVQAHTVCQTYVVNTGDTIGTIAEKFSVTVTSLEATLANCNLLVTGYKPGDFLQMNQKICLPGWVPSCLSVQSAGGNEACKYYTVQQGDTLDTIGAAFKIPRQDIVFVNPKINPTIMAVNTFVKLPDWDDAVCSQPGNTASCRVYVAESGDSISSIATAFSIQPAVLQATNTELGADATVMVQPGQRVKLPPFGENCGDGVQVKKTSNCRAYNVIAGDTIASIAAMFQTSAADLAAVNSELMANSVLSPGTQIKLPPTPPPLPPSPPSPPPMDPPAPKPVVPEVPKAAPEAAPAPEANEPQVPAPAPQPTPVEAPSPAPAPVGAPEPTLAPSSAVASTTSLLVLLAMVGGTLALF